MMMKNNSPVKTIIAVGTLASAAMWLSSKPNRLKAETSFRDMWDSSKPLRIKAQASAREWKRKVKPSAFDKSENLPIEKGGIPHPHDLEDNNMVSEGAQYSVQFYNEKMQ
jgi:hypothetical protein